MSRRSTAWAPTLALVLALGAPGALASDGGGGGADGNVRDGGLLVQDNVGDVERIRRARERDQRELDENSRLMDQQRGRGRTTERAPPRTEPRPARPARTEPWSPPPPRTEPRPAPQPVYHPETARPTAILPVLRLRDAPTPPDGWAGFMVLPNGWTVYYYRDNTAVIQGPAGERFKFVQRLPAAFR